MNELQDEKKHGLIYRFFSRTWGIVSWLRTATLNIIFIVIVVIIFVSIKKQAPDILPDSFALELAPSGILVDELSPINPTQALLGNDSDRNPETLVSDLIKTIDHARDDSQVHTLILKLSYLRGGGMGHLQEISAALADFKAAGKKIIAYSSFYNQSQYFLAVHADKIYLHNMGEVSLRGFGSYRLYYKEALDKLNISVDIFRAGEYKDAIEPYIRNNMSEASREQNGQWINSLWQSYTTHVETLRDLPNGAINALINHLDTELAQVNGDTAQLALQKNLVDEVASLQQIRAALIAELGEGHKQGTYKAVSSQRYLTRIKPVFESSSIGIITASGTISSGYQLEGAIGDESMVQLLQKVRDDSSIKALVIRINSGGGSAVASEVIRAEVQAVRDSGIPVVISMGNVAASGGYWIATAADEIWALPTTITGSIGVFGIRPNTQKALMKIGIHSDGIGSTDIANAGYLNSAPNPKVNAVAQLGVDAIYQKFLSLVSEARGLSIAEVDDIAGGRVWSGEKALELHLVDKLGSLKEAIASAAALANVNTWKIKRIVRDKTPSEIFIESFMNTKIAVKITNTIFQPSASLQKLEQAVAPLLLELNNLHMLQKPAGIYAECVACDFTNL